MNAVGEECIWEEWGEENVNVNSYIIFVRFRDRVIEAGR